MLKYLVKKHLTRHLAISCGQPGVGTSEYGTKRDQYNKVTFDPIETTGLRIELEMQPKFSSGILEWRVE